MEQHGVAFGLRPSLSTRSRPDVGRGRRGFFTYGLFSFVNPRPSVLPRGPSSPTWSACWGPHVPSGPLTPVMLLPCTGSTPQKCQLFSRPCAVCPPRCAFWLRLRRPRPTARSGSGCGGLAPPRVLAQAAAAVRPTACSGSGCGGLAPPRVLAQAAAASPRRAFWLRLQRPCAPPRVLAQAAAASPRRAFWLRLRRPRPQFCKPVWLCSTARGSPSPPDPPLPGPSPGPHLCLFPASCVTPHHPSPEPSTTPHWLPGLAVPRSNAERVFLTHLTVSLWPSGPPTVPFTRQQLVLPSRQTIS